MFEFAKNGLVFILIIDDSLLPVIFVITLSSGVITFLGLLLTLYFPKVQLWPPPKLWSWEFCLFWLFESLFYSGIILLTIKDGKISDEFYSVRFSISTILAFVGIVLGLWGMSSLGFIQSLGLERKLIIKGPYRYTRNPQYLGATLLLVSVIIIVNSFLVAVTSMIAILWFLIAPFCEERWLLYQYGSNYQKYLTLVPRFVGINSIKPKIFDEE